MSDRPELHMERFCGPEVYEVADTGWNLYPDEDDGVMTLCCLTKLSFRVLIVCKQSLL